MIAGLPVHWIAYEGDSIPVVLRPYDKVYVRTFEGSEPQHPIRADHVHWANVVSFAVAHDAHDQPAHHEAHDPTIQTMEDIYDKL
jgi:hypothetical protein